MTTDIFWIEYRVITSGLFFFHLSLNRKLSVTQDKLICGTGHTVSETK
jgi:hypothetical protein